MNVGMIAARTPLFTPHEVQRHISATSHAASVLCSLTTCERCKHRWRVSQWQPMNGEVVLCQPHRYHKMSSTERGTNRLSIPQGKNGHAPACFLFPCFVPSCGHFPCVSTRNEQPRFFLQLITSGPAITNFKTQKADGITSSSRVLQWHQSGVFFFMKSHCT